jgi:hypothetical protein
MPLLSKQFKLTSQALLLLLAIVTIPKPAQAFDTGHHFDLTQDAMQDQGFGKTSIEVAQLENWLTDYYDRSLNTQFSSETNKLHFDDLYNTRQVSNYWGHFTVNTKNAIQQATREKNALKLLTVMGISLHAVQDFYTHSNWAEQHPNNTSTNYRTETWFDNFDRRDAPGGLNIYTGAVSGPAPANHPTHGGYNDGLNKDQYSRSNWQHAYTFAYVASREWVNAMRTWSQEVDPNFWAQVRTFNVSSGNRTQLNNDLEAVYRLSEWAKGVSVHGYGIKPNDDGHWKGKGSGSTNDFVKFLGNWSAKAPGIFVNQFKASHTLLSKGLTGVTAPTATAPKVPNLALNHRAIIVRTIKVDGTDSSFLGEKDLDMYAHITVGEQKFTEVMQSDRSRISPYWFTIRFVPKNVALVPIKYELFDEDGVGRGDDDHLDINPLSGKLKNLDFTFNVNNHALTDGLTGVHDTVSTAITSEGKESRRAKVQFYVTERELVRDDSPILIGP